MAKAINQVLLMGNITKDPKLDYIEGGNSKVRFSIAINRSFQQNNEWKETVDYVECLAWGRLAEQIATSVTKGQKILLEGRIQSSTWEKDGKVLSKMEVLVTEATFLQRPTRLEVKEQ